MASSDNNVNLQPGDKVAWNFAGSHAEGTVSEVSTEKMTKESAGKTITRNGTEDNPAVFVERKDSSKNPVAKKGSELHKMTEDEKIPGNTHVETPALMAKK